MTKERTGSDILIVVTLRQNDLLGHGSRKRRAEPFVTRHGAVGVVCRIARRAPRLPARRVEGEGIPTMIRPSVGGHVRLLEDKMFLTVKGEEVADQRVRPIRHQQLWC
jgi:hypothetical protein